MAGSATTAKAAVDHPTAPAGELSEISAAAATPVSEVLEQLGCVVGLGGVERRDLDERRERLAHRLRIDHRTVSGDRAPRFEPLQAGLHGGHRQAGGLGEVRERGTPVLGQGGEDREVDRIVHIWNNILS